MVPTRLRAGLAPGGAAVRGDLPESQREREPGRASQSEGDRESKRAKERGGRIEAVEGYLEELLDPASVKERAHHEVAVALPVAFQPWGRLVHSGMAVQSAPATTEPSQSTGAQVAEASDEPLLVYCTSTSSGRWPGRLGRTAVADTPRWSHPAGHPRTGGRGMKSRRTPSTRRRRRQALHPSHRHGRRRW